MRKNNYRSMELLRSFKPPDIAENITKCFASGFYVILDFEKLNTIEGLEYFLTYSQFLRLFYTSSPENYVYDNVDKALDAFIKGAKWLAFHNIPERFLVFRQLTYNVINQEFGSYIEDYEKYDPKDMDEFRNLIEFFADWLRVSDADMMRIATEEFCDVQQDWQDLDADTAA